MRFIASEIASLTDQFDYLQPGESERINHTTDCSGDSKSLKITCNDDGSISMRCFRCGRWGKTKPSNTHRVEAHKRISKLTVPKNITLPRDVSSAFGIKQKVWLNKFGLTLAELNDYGIVYSTKHDSIVIPIYVNGKLEGYQERHFKPNAPKYTTMAHDKRSLWWKSRNVTDNKLVLVEDVLSGIKVGRHCSSVALLGTHLPISLLRWMSKYKEIIVWLDNDNRVVKMKQEDIATRISVLVPKVRVVKTSIDPKECKDDTVRTIIFSDS